MVKCPECKFLVGKIDDKDLITCLNCSTIFSYLTGVRKLRPEVIKEEKIKLFNDYKKYYSIEIISFLEIIETNFPIPHSKDILIEVMSDIENLEKYLETNEDSENENDEIIKNKFYKKLIKEYEKYMNNIKLLKNYKDKLNLIEILHKDSIDSEIKFLNLSVLQEIFPEL